MKPNKCQWWCELKGCPQNFYKGLIEPTKTMLLEDRVCPDTCEIVKLNKRVDEQWKTIRGINRILSKRLSDLEKGISYLKEVNKDQG